MDNPTALIGVAGSLIAISMALLAVWYYNRYGIKRFSTPPSHGEGSTVTAWTAGLLAPYRIGFTIVAVLAVAGWVREVNSDHRESDQWFLRVLSWTFTFAAPILFAYCVRRILAPNRKNTA